VRRQRAVRLRQHGKGLHKYRAQGFDIVCEVRLALSTNVTAVIQCRVITLQFQALQQ